MVSVYGFMEAARHAVEVRAEFNAVKMCNQAIMPKAQSKHSNCLSSWPVCYFGCFLFPWFLG